MTPRSLSIGYTVAAAIIACVGTLSGAGSNISGTVKVTGAASNADVVVYLQQAPGAPVPPAKPTEMDQRKFQFTPHVLPVVVGTTVRFLNSDPTPHNVFSPDNEKYNLGTWPQGQTKDYTFNKCAKPPCVYTQLCRVHPEMEGFVIVLQNPYFAVTAKDGHYEIRDAPPGNYTLAVWHQKAKSAPKSITVEAGKPTMVDFILGR
jgi:plastocyanin